MNRALEFYKNEKSVGSIAGYAPPITFRENYPFRCFFCISLLQLGMGNMSKEVWDKVDWDLTYIPEFYHNPEMR